VKNNPTDQSFVSHGNRTNGSSVHSSASKTSIKIQRRSGSRKKDEKEDHSLEKVHTFHLKKSPSNESKLFASGGIAGSNGNLNKVQVERVYYIQENTNSQDEAVIRNVQPIINELLNRI
jgi:hypothetical protein